jgi:hypothetical protein
VEFDDANVDGGFRNRISIGFGVPTQSAFGLDHCDAFVQIPKSDRSICSRGSSANDADIVVEDILGCKFVLVDYSANTSQQAEASDAPEESETSNHCHDPKKS